MKLQETEKKALMTFLIKSGRENEYKRILSDLTQMVLWNGMRK